MRASVVLAVLMLAGSFASAQQITLRPTPAPLVTADNESWYQLREPIFVESNYFYPAGPQVFFNASEMVRTGHYRGIPVYAQPTVDPMGRIFVPLAGSLMQPYERRRSGELAGTVGATTPSFPVDRDTELPRDESVVAGAVGATGTTGFTRAPFDCADCAVPTAGRTAAPISRPRLVSAAKPQGLNGVYIEYSGRRWFNSGPAVTLDPARLTIVGEYRDLHVYGERGRPDTIFVPVTGSAETLVSPYSTRR